MTLLTEADTRRGAIVQEITEHNRTLETIVQRCKRLKAPLEKQRQTLLIESTPLGAKQNKLTQIGYAHPQLVLDHHCNQQRSRPRARNKPTRWPRVRESIKR